MDWGGKTGGLIPSLCHLLTPLSIKMIQLLLLFLQMTSRWELASLFMSVRSTAALLPLPNHMGTWDCTVSWEVEVKVGV